MLGKVRLDPGIQKEASREKLVKSKGKSGVWLIVMYKVTFLVFNKSTLVM